ncbi:spore coat protein B [Paenibacillus phyllosphaerae]|uniref:Spore coat protein B n=1 Tax=Paenibacillus phyllosphaerae TaxID=274593 RepID=A0A7W5B625_9BACL|nr:hypothetical protein [Paenibacillus phyllosphaerae]MBB3114336.1 spore coat protein B [Paenibacillus phyllosphaerae]
MSYMKPSHYGYKKESDYKKEDQKKETDHKKDHSMGNKHESSGKKPGRDSYLNNQVGKTIKINKGGPDSFEGELVGAESDYVVLNTTAGLAYINYSHIKSLTEMSGDTSKGAHVATKYIKAANFNGVLSQLTKSFVQLNWGGPEKVEGFIAEVSSDSVLLVVGPDIMRIPLFHIKTVRKAGKFVNGGNKSGGQKGGQNGSKSGGQNGNKSGGQNGSKSGGQSGNKSGGQKGGKSGGQSGNKSGGQKGGKSGGHNDSKSGGQKGGKSNGYGSKSGGSKSEHGKTNGSKSYGKKSTGHQEGSKSHKSGNKNGNKYGKDNKGRTYL